MSKKPSKVSILPKEEIPSQDEDFMNMLKDLEYISESDYEEDEDGDEDDFDLDALFDDNSDESELFENLPKLPPDAIEQIYAMAYDFYNKSKYEDAGQIFRWLMLLEPGDLRHWMGLAASLQKNKQYVEATTIYAFASTLDVENAYIPLHGAECLFAAGNVKEGLCALEDAKERAEGNSVKYKEVLDQVEVLTEAWGEKKSKKIAKIKKDN